MKNYISSLIWMITFLIVPIFSQAQEKRTYKEFRDTLEVYDPAKNESFKRIVISKQKIKGAIDTVEIYDPINGRHEIRIMEHRYQPDNRPEMRSDRRPDMMHGKRDFYTSPEENAMNITKYKKGRNLGIGLLIGGALVSGLGGTMTVLSFVEKDKGDDYRFSDDPDPLTLIAGVGTFMLGTATMTTGTVLTIVNSVKLSKARKMSERFGSIELNSGNSGLGLCFKF